MMPRHVLEYINRNYERSLDDLFEFLSIPSVSTVESHAGDVRKAAAWLLDRLKRPGLDATLFETPGHPIVYAEMCPYQDAPTLMFYAHYDVTPIGSPEEWQTPSFSPVLKNGTVYARGAVDDKGHLFSIIQAIGAVLAVEGKLPLNVKLLFEGEEEMGSPSIDAFIKEHRRLLCSDAIVIIDILKYRSDLPAIYYGAKGLVSVITEVSGPAVSVHSGIYGGEIANPAQALAHIIDHLKDSDGKILIPGFYNRVRDIGPEERAAIASLPFDETRTKALLGEDALVPEKGYTPLECAMARPTLDVNGLWGGALPGEPLMIIPSDAGALISMRLVPDQRPGEIFGQFEAYVHSLVMPGVKLKLRVHACQGAFITPRNSDAVTVMGHALEFAFGHRPVLIRSGGTSGIVPLLYEATGTREAVITGWGDPGDGEHSPNEHFSLENYRRGIIATAALIYELASIGHGGHGGHKGHGGSKW